MTDPDNPENPECPACLAKNVPMVTFPCFPTHRICLRCEKKMPIKYCPSCRIPYSDIAEIFKYAYSLYTKGKCDEANKYYKIVIEVYEIEDRPVLKSECYRLALMNLGCNYHNRGNYELAKKYYLTAEKEGCYDVYQRLGRVYFAEKLYGESEKYFRLSIEKGICDSNIYNNLGRIYLIQSKLDDASTYFVLAIESGDKTHATFNLGIVHLKRSELDDAEKMFKIAKDNGNGPDANYQLGRIAEYRGNLIEAEKYYLAVTGMPERKFIGSR